MKHLLFIAFHYPPESSSSGVLRSLKFTNYLPEHGWRVSVLSIREDAYRFADPALLAQIPPEVKVYRTRYLNTRKHLSIKNRYPGILAVPDSWIGWYLWAVPAGKEILRSDPVDLVISTSPHATAHLIGARLASLAAVPHVLDFRDPWYEEPPEPDTPPIVHWSARKLERRVVGRAAHVVTSTNELRDLLRSRYPQQSANKFSTVLNGYDESDFADLPRVPDAQNSVCLTFVHAGSINPEFRDPRPLFDVLGKLIKIGKLRRECLRLRFIGAGDFAESPEMTDNIHANGLEQVVQFVGRVSFREALVELLRGDVSLLLQASLDTASLVPAKLYEYLRAQKPILALVSQGASQEIIENTGGGWAADPSDARQLTAAVEAIASAWHGGRLQENTAPLSKLGRYERRNLTSKLAKILDHTVDDWPELRTDG